MAFLPDKAKHRSYRDVSYLHIDLLRCHSKVRLNAQIKNSRCVERRGDAAATARDGAREPRGTGQLRLSGNEFNTGHPNDSVSQTVQPHLSPLPFKLRGPPGSNNPEPIKDTCSSCEFREL